MHNRLIFRYRRERAHTEVPVAKGLKCGFGWFLMERTDPLVGGKQ
jgi:hypothetical protein